MRREGDAVLSVQRLLAGVLPVLGAQPWDVRVALEPGKDPKRPFALVEEIAGAATTRPAATADVSARIACGLYLPKAASAKAAERTESVVRDAVWRAVHHGVDPVRDTPNRIPLWTYEPRVEVHRIKVSATGGTFDLTIGTGDTLTLPAPLTAAALDAAITAELGAAAGDVVVLERGTGLFDVHYQGALAGVRVGDPVVDDSALTGPRAYATGRLMLAGAPAPWRAPADYLRVSGYEAQAVSDASDPLLVMVGVTFTCVFARGPALRFGQRIIQRVDSRSRPVT